MLLTKKVAETKSVSVKLLIHEALAAREDARSHRVVHASDIVDNENFCARQFALFDLTGKRPRGKFVGTAMRVTFEYGRFIQKQVNEVWLKDRMYGDWRCPHCNFKLAARRAPKFACPECGHRHWAYEEFRVHSDLYGVSGGLDTILDLGLSKLRFCEVKSMDKDYFKDLKAPLQEHRRRSALYLRLLSESNHPLAQSIDHEVSHLLYVSKSFGFKDQTLHEAGIKDAQFSPFKEYLVHADHPLLDKELAAAMALRKFRDRTGPIPDGICASCFVKVAKYCPVVDDCFSGKYGKGYMLPEKD